MDEQFIHNWQQIKDRFWSKFPNGQVYLNEENHRVAVSTCEHKLLVNYIHAGCKIIPYNNIWIVANETAEILNEFQEFREN